MLFLWHVLRIVEIRVVWRRGSWVRVIQLCKEKHKIEVQNGCIFFIKIYKQVIFQHECIVSHVQSASGKALHCAWHFHRRNSSVLAYLKTGNDQYAPFSPLPVIRHTTCSHSNRLKSTEICTSFKKTRIVLFKIRFYFI